MIEIRQTEYYRKWFDKLKDKNARARIDIRLRRLSLGNFGDFKSLGQIKDRLWPWLSCLLYEKGFNADNTSCRWR